jgi:hypothetical protein
MSKNDFDTVE